MMTENITTIITTIASLLGLLLTLYTIHKTITDTIVSQSSRQKDIVEFSEKLVLSVKNNKDNFVIEKLFESIFLKTIDSKYIFYFIENWQNPSNSIKKFLLSRDFLNLKNEENVLSYNLSWASKLKRNVYYVYSFSSYVIFALIALSPLFFLEHIFKENIRILVIVPLMISFGWYAILMLKEGIKIKIAEELIKESKYIKESAKQTAT